MNAGTGMRRFLLLLMIVLLAGCAQERTSSPPANDLMMADVPSPGMVEARHLLVLGTVLPAQTVRLGFAVGGPVQMVYVDVGQEVRTGDLLASLAMAALESEVREAEEALALSQARLEQARAGPVEGGIAAAEAEYRRVLAQHEALLAGARREEVMAAQAEVQAAVARSQQVASGASQEDLIVAGAVLDKAAVAVRRAQAAYDLIAWRPDVAASPQAAALHVATVDYEAARAEYKRLKTLPSQADLEQARSELAQAGARLALMKAGPTEEEIAVSAGAVDVARAQLELARSGPRAEDVAVAEAQVQQGRTALEQAKQALGQAQLLAPFDGTVSAVTLQPGEWAGPGMPVVELLDTGHWRVETRNVGELDVGRVQRGQQAVVRVMAFGDRELTGQVVAISPVAVVQQGDTTYTVFVELESSELNLRPGMNAEVEIETD